eukprot:415467-Hanusia_phi.AAC.1
MKEEKQKVEEEELETLLDLTCCWWERESTLSSRKACFLEFRRNRAEGLLQRAEASLMAAEEEERRRGELISALEEEKQEVEEEKREVEEEARRREGELRRYREDEESTGERITKIECACRTVDEALSASWLMLEEERRRLQQEATVARQEEEEERRRREEVEQQIKSLRVQTHQQIELLARESTEVTKNATCCLSAAEQTSNKTKEKLSEELEREKKLLAEAEYHKDCAQKQVKPGPGFLAC